MAHGMNPTLCSMGKVTTIGLAMLLGASALAAAPAVAVDRAGVVLAADAKSGPDYDQGYRDGLANKTMRIKDSANRAYTDGYRAGKDERASKRGGTLFGKRTTKDLVGRPSKGLAGDMKSLGYTKKADVKAGGKGLTAWRGPGGATDCVQVTTSKNKVSDVQPLPEAECR
jgi:hypothetical protein